MHLGGPFEEPEEAWAVADGIAWEAERRNPLGRGMPELEPVGKFVIPPAGAPSREFQVLHIDFGLPVDPGSANDVARYTALHVARSHPETSAQTRVVSLRALLGQRRWPPADVLVGRLLAYGRTHGASGERTGYVEGILARLVEAADERPPSLPGVGESVLLCGQEFGDLAEERAHFLERGLRLDGIEQLVRVGPGELLIIDNLATAHGRLGARVTGELHQLMLGHRQLGIEQQLSLRREVLGAFDRSAGLGLSAALP